VPLTTGLSLSGANPLSGKATQHWIAKLEIYRGGQLPCASDHIPFPPTHFAGEAENLADEASGATVRASRQLIGCWHPIVCGAILRLAAASKRAIKQRAGRLAETSIGCADSDAVVGSGLAAAHTRAPVRSDLRPGANSRSAAGRSCRHPLVDLARSLAGFARTQRSSRRGLLRLREQAFSSPNLRTLFLT
jgi:hypothetical protein